MYPAAGGWLTPAEEAHFLRVYPAAKLRMFHCERVRKLPPTGLGSSMLIGFECRDEAESLDLRRRVGEVCDVRLFFHHFFAALILPHIPLSSSLASCPCFLTLALPRQLFSAYDLADDDDDMGLESISDPEEVAEADDDGFDDGDVSSASHAPSSSASHAVSKVSHGSHAAASRVRGIRRGWYGRHRDRLGQPHCAAARAD
jgi:cysteine protease ATG4